MAQKEIEFVYILYNGLYICGCAQTFNVIQLSIGNVSFTEGNHFSDNVCKIFSCFHMITREPLGLYINTEIHKSDCSSNIMFVQLISIISNGSLAIIEQETV